MLPPCARVLPAWKPNMLRTSCAKRSCPSPRFHAFESGQSDSAGRSALTLTHGASARSRRSITPLRVLNRVAERYDRCESGSDLADESLNQRKRQVRDVGGECEPSVRIPPEKRALAWLPADPSRTRSNPPRAAASVTRLGLLYSERQHPSTPAGLRQGSGEVPPKRF